MSVVIYALSDPETGEIRYVGKTAQRPARRLNAHIQDRAHSHKKYWIKTLRERGLKPTIEVLETIENSDDRDWQESERFWIAYLRFFGCRLTNLDNGGKGCGSMSEETKRKLSIAHTGKKLSPEHIEKLAAANRGKIISLKQRIFMRERFLGIPRTPETISKMRAARLGVKLGPSKRRGIPSGTKGIKRGPLSSEHRAKLSVIGKGRAPTIDHRAHISAGLVGKPKSVEHRAKLSAALRGRKIPREQVERQRAKLLGRKQSPEAVAARVASRAANKAKRGHVTQLIFTL